MLLKSRHSALSHGGEAVHEQMPFFRPQQTSGTATDSAAETGIPVLHNPMHMVTAAWLGSCAAHLHGCGQQDDCVIDVLHLGQNS